jgi:hypothetical protein
VQQREHEFPRGADPLPGLTDAGRNRFV